MTNSMRSIAATLGLLLAGFFSSSPALAETVLITGANQGIGL